MCCDFLVYTSRNEVRKLENFHVSSLAICSGNVFHHFAFIFKDSMLLVKL